MVFVSGGTLHVPSDLKYLLAAPAAGAGAYPAVPAAEVVAPFNAIHVFVSVNLALAGTLLFTVCPLTVAELPPLAGRKLGKSVI